MGSAMDEKPCRICTSVLPLGEFHRAAGARDGHRNECKACFREIARRNYSAKRDERIAATKAWRVANPERLAAYTREYRNRPERKRALRDLYYRRTYGLSADEVDSMLEAQGGGCAICGQRPDRLASLHLDHDHATGAIRGFLCVSCNQGLGQFRDDPRLLASAIEYLQRQERQC